MARKRTMPLTLDLLRSWGWNYWIVESFNSFSGKKNDLFNIIDVLVITQFSTIGVQSCGGDFSQHIQKLCVEEKDKTIKWIESHERKLILIGWRKILRERGKRATIYKPRIAWIYPQGEDLVCEEKETGFFGQA